MLTILLFVSCISDEEALRYYDRDQDGFPVMESADVGGRGPYDCDDADPLVNPAADEVCNGIDDDCDGDVDEEGGTLTFYEDWDRDGYGADEQAVQACERPSGFVEQGGDCDDSDADVNPKLEWFRDADGDDYGVESAPTQQACEQPNGFTDNTDDCDDTRADVNPGLTEDCVDGVDNDCDGAVDASDFPQFEGDTSYCD